MPLLLLLLRLTFILPPKPKLLLADEPTGNVDPEMSRRLMHLFFELNRIGTTTVIATHEAELIRLVEAPVLQLEGGRLARIDQVDTQTSPFPETQT